MHALPYPRVQNTTTAVVPANTDRDSTTVIISSHDDTSDGAGADTGGQDKGGSEKDGDDQFFDTINPTLQYTAAPSTRAHSLTNSLTLIPRDAESETESNNHGKFDGGESGRVSDDEVACIPQCANICALHDQG